MINTVFKGKKNWAHYDVFKIHSAQDKYRLEVSDYTGNMAVDGMNSENGNKFTTNDQDNDGSPHNCAVNHAGGWWYRSCSSVNLNGQYNPISYVKGIRWHLVTGTSRGGFSFTEMKIRPKQE